MLLLIHVLVFYLLWRGKGLNARRAFVFALAATGVVGTVLVECLSCWGMVSKPGFVAGWTLSVTLAAVSAAPSWIEQFRRGLRWRPRLRIDGYTAAIVLILGAALVTGLVYVPNNWDSMTYHLPRVIRWLQHGNVSPFVTNVSRQNWYNPGAEYLVLNVMGLGSSDRLAFVVQWCAFAGLVVMISLLAERLGASLRGQRRAAFLAATTPMFILESTTTQNDLVGAFWITLYVFWLVDGDNLFTKKVAVGILSGTFLGLAALTKATAYIFCIPFVVWGSWRLWRRESRSTWLWSMVAQGCSAFIFCGPYWLRNWVAAGSIFGAPEIADFMLITKPSLQAAASNVLRNIVLQLPIVGFEVAAAGESVLRAIHRVLGIAADDPMSSFRGMFSLNPITVHEDVAPNLVQFAWIGVASGFACLSFLKAESGRTANVSPRTYVLLVGAAALVFCTMLKWSLWHSRYHVGLFALSLPLCGLGVRAKLSSGGLSTFIQRSKSICRIAALLGATAGALLCFFDNKAKPIRLFSVNPSQRRIDQTFVLRPELGLETTLAVEAIGKAKCRESAPGMCVS